MSCPLVVVTVRLFRSVSNATAGGTPEQVDYLVQNGCIKPLCDLLDVTDTKIVGCCLEGIDNILRVVGGGGSP